MKKLMTCFTNNKNEINHYVTVLVMLLQNSVLSHLHHMKFSLGAPNSLHSDDRFAVHRN